MSRKKSEYADGKTLWYAVEHGKRDGLYRNWTFVPGWYSKAEARSLRAKFRRCGYSARIVRCEVVG